MTVTMTRGGQAPPRVVFIGELLCPRCLGNFVTPWGAIRFVTAGGGHFTPIPGHRCLLCDLQWRQT